MTPSHAAVALSIALLGGCQWIAGFSSGGEPTVGDLPGDVARDATPEGADAAPEGGEAAPELGRDDQAVDAGPFRVVDMSPPHNAVDVPRDVTIVVELSQKVVPSSVDDSTVVLARAHQPPTPKILAVNGNQISITPTGPLAIHDTYRVSLGSDITSADGRPLVPYTGVLTTARGAWGLERIIDSRDDAVSKPRLTMARSVGDATAVWLQHDGQRPNVWAARLAAADSSWSVAQTIGGSSNSPADAPDVAMSPAGRTIAVWIERDGVHNSVRGAELKLAGGTWTSPEALENDHENDFSSPRIAFGDGGALAAIWQDTSAPNAMWGNTFDQLVWSLWANRYE